MGAESAARRSVDGKWVAGKAFLETDEFVFRGGDAGCKVLYKEIRSIKADGNRVELKTAKQSFVFELETDPRKWVEKIQNPKSRIDKVGVKPAQRVSVVGMEDSDFMKELEARSVKVAASGVVDAFFAYTTSKKGLSKVKQWEKRLDRDGSLWIVYPKGRPEITENDVLAAGRAAGLKDVKVVRFSERDTALKFVVPLDRR